MSPQKAAPFRRGRNLAVAGAGAFCFAWMLCAFAIAAKPPGRQNKPDQDAALQAEAKATFEGVCASCHGLDGRGAERGPDLVSRPEVVRKTDAELLRILTEGKSGGGMPSFASYGPAKLSTLVAYLRTLQGRGKEAVPLPGDPSHGKALFFGKAKCGDCHMTNGQGGFFAEDLTTYGARLRVEEIRSAIVDPNKNLDPRRGLITVVLADSTSLFGMPRNEDNFSLQLQTPDGVFHLLSKSEISKLTYTGRSAMPADYGSTLSATELNDLVSYLLRVAGADASTMAAPNPDDGEEE